MSMKEELPMNRKYITVAVVVVLCIAAFGYSKGWFNTPSPSPEMESTKVSTSQTLDPANASKDVAQATEGTAKPAGTATK